ncbi:MAG: YncE family protein [Bacteroides sp.]|nr:YncE family protein [Bacteroides sp.]
MRIQGALISTLLLTLTGCMRWDYGEEEVFSCPPQGLFIVCEGNFQYGNATLSFYDPATGQVENEVFYRANGMKLGDVAQSMTIGGNRGWIAVNNSHAVFAIDLTSLRETGRVEGLTSPRYVHFVTPEKAYISQLWDNRIIIFNPQTYSVTGAITIPGMEASVGSSEQMIQSGKFVYCNCWSYQNRIIRIDSERDAVDKQVEVGLQPNSLVMDANGKLWTITDGGYDGSPAGYETPAIFRIDPESMTIELRMDFKLGDSPRDLTVSADGATLYWINDDVWSMPSDATTLPSAPLIPSRRTIYYALAVDPRSDEIYLADAIDYQQPGMIYRYSPSGELISRFYAGVTPTYFCWK